MAYISFYVNVSWSYLGLVGDILLLFSFFIFHFPVFPEGSWMQSPSCLLDWRWLSYYREFPPIEWGMLDSTYQVPGCTQMLSKWKGCAGWTINMAQVAYQTSPAAWGHWTGPYHVLSGLLRLNDIWSTLGRPLAHASWETKDSHLVMVSRWALCQVPCNILRLHS